MHQTLQAQNSLWILKKCGLYFLSFIAFIAKKDPLKIASKSFASDFLLFLRFNQCIQHLFSPRPYL